MSVWKPIPNYYPYEACDNGEIRNGKTKYVIYQNFYDVGNHRKIGVNINGKRKTVFVHRLVALAFIPNPKNYPIFHHINGNPRDNRVENLAWVSPSYNANEPICKARQRAAHKGKPVIGTDSDGTEFKYHSGREACRALGIAESSVALCLNGRQKTAAGRAWRYAE